MSHDTHKDDNENDESNHLLHLIRHPPNPQVRIIKSTLLSSMFGAIGGAVHSAWFDNPMPKETFSKRLPLQLSIFKSWVGPFAAFGFTYQTTAEILKAVRGKDDEWNTIFGATLGAATLGVISIFASLFIFLENDPKISLSAGTAAFIASAFFSKVDAISPQPKAQVDHAIRRLQGLPPKKQHP